MTDAAGWPDDMTMCGDGIRRAPVDGEACPPWGNPGYLDKLRNGMKQPKFSKTMRCEPCRTVWLEVGGTVCFICNECVRERAKLAIAQLDAEKQAIVDRINAKYDERERAAS